MTNRAAEVLIYELIKTADEYKRTASVAAHKAQELKDLQTAVKNFDQYEIKKTSQIMELAGIVNMDKIKEAMAIDPEIGPAIYPNDGPERAAEAAIIENWHQIMAFLVDNQGDKAKRKYYEPIMEIMRPLIPEQGNDEEPGQ